MEIIEKPIKISSETLALMVNAIRGVVSDMMNQQLYGDSYKEFIREICKEEIDKSNVT